jgi:hypothetical protein
MACAAQQHRFTYNEAMPVESCTQALSDLALRFGEDDDEEGGMVRCARLIWRYIPAFLLAHVISVAEAWQLRIMLAHARQRRRWHGQAGFAVRMCG